MNSLELLFYLAFRYLLASYQQLLSFLFGGQRFSLCLFVDFFYLLFRCAEYILSCLFSCADYVLSLLFSGRCYHSCRFLGFLLGIGNNSGDLLLCPLNCLSAGFFFFLVYFFYSLFYLGEEFIRFCLRLLLLLCPISCLSEGSFCLLVDSFYLLLGLNKDSLCFRICLLLRLCDYYLRFCFGFLLCFADNCGSPLVRLFLDLDLAALRLLFSLNYGGIGES